MTRQSKQLAGALLIIMTTVIFGGVSILTLLINDPKYVNNPVRQDLWRAGHAHAAVLLVLSLVALRYVDETRLSYSLTWIARLAIPTAAILVPAGFFLSVLSSDAQDPNALIYLTYAGAAVLSCGLVLLGIGLLRAKDPAWTGGEKGQKDKARRNED